MLTLVFDELLPKMATELELFSSGMGAGPESFARGEVWVQATRVLGSINMVHSFHVTPSLFQQDEGERIRVV